MIDKGDFDALNADNIGGILMSKGKVSQVRDGDTIKIAYGPWIRLANVDAPELRTKGGAVAKQELAKLVAGKTVTFNEVGKSYGRVVADVKIGGKDVNAAMRKKGY